MKKELILGICITALLAFAAWAPNANARSSFYNDECAGCHDGDYTTSTCAGCHAHGTHGDSGKGGININATPDSTTYNPGDTIVVQVEGGYRPGWVRVQMWDLDCNIANTCNQSNVLAEESLYTSGSQVDFPGPVALTATVPDTPGDYTWYAGWYGNESDTSTGSNASNLWIADSTNSGHGNELVAFTFTVTGCTVDLDCDDGSFCNGDETCDGAGACQAGTPVVCDDGVGCTDDSCNETTDSCDYTANNTNCPDDGQFCTGTAYCDAVNDCQAGTPPCDPATETCDDVGDVCEPLGCQSDAECDNGEFCDGAETCDQATGQCLPGTPVNVDDGVGCTDDSCDEVNDVVVNAPNDGLCDNGEFCDGAETCDAVNDCQAGTPPCDPATETCDETNEICVEPIFIDLDIAKFSAPKSVRLAKVKPVEIKLVVKNSGDFNSQTREATVTGMQNGLKVYEETQNVSDDLGNGRSTFKFGPYTPTATGDILWSATIADDDPDDDTATAVTTVK